MITSGSNSRHSASRRRRPRPVQFYRDFLPTLGHEVVAALTSGSALVQACRAVPCDLLLTEALLPDLGGIAAAIAVVQATPVPVILITACRDADVIDRALRGPVLTYLCKPVHPVELAANVLLARRRFEELRDLGAEVARLRQALADRRLIDQAKCILMKRACLEEPEAYRRLHELASAKKLKAVEIARALLLAEEAFAPP
jgi:response regulator NasT